MAELLLKDSNNHVTGLARNCSITHERYVHVEMDLADETQMKKWSFPELKIAEKICLVNNAGIVGAIRYVGGMGSESIARTYHVNLIAPALLMNSFLKSYANHLAKQVIINVSSGAGKTPVDGWSVYCSSKAGLDMLTQTAAAELKIAGRKNVFVFAVAPGVVDSAMQDEIRQASKADFSRIQAFADYKTSDQLAHPDFVAAKYLAILEFPEQFTDVVFSVKDLGDLIFATNSLITRS